MSSHSHKLPVDLEIRATRLDRPVADFPAEALPAADVPAVDVLADTFGLAMFRLAMFTTRRVRFSLESESSFGVRDCAIPGAQSPPASATIRVRAKEF